MNEGHKVEGCKGRWIDVGTLRDPFRQLCTGCRAARQKPAEDDEVVDVAALKAAEDRHMKGLARLRVDLEAGEAWNRDCVHQDEAGFWFWDETWTVRYGPWDTEEECRRELAGYVRYLDEGLSVEKPGFIEPNMQGCLTALYWIVGLGVFWALAAWLGWKVWRALT